MNLVLASEECESVGRGLALGRGRVTHPLVVSSKPGSLLSIARNTQFSRISVITTLSNHGFRMSDTHNRRTGFSFRNTHSDFSGSSCGVRGGWGARVFVSPRGLAINTMRGSSDGRNRCGGRDDIGGDASLHRTRGERPGRARSKSPPRAAEESCPVPGAVTTPRGACGGRRSPQISPSYQPPWGLSASGTPPRTLARPVGSSAPAWCPPPRCPVNNGALRRTL